MTIVKKINERAELTRKEKEAVEYIELAGMRGRDVKSLSNKFNISYPAAYSLLKNSTKKGWLEYKWEKTGNKGRFYPNK